MRPIRAPSFADVLEDVAVDTLDEPQGDGAYAPASGPDWLFEIFAAAAEAAVVADAPAAAYRESSGTAIEAEECACLGTSEAEIAAELNLATAQSLDDIARIRRGFARRNHPDLLHPRLADQATVRMKIANMLIDRRARELKPRI